MGRDIMKWGSHTKKAIIEYKNLPNWKTIPEDKNYYLTFDYEGQKLEIVRHKRRALDYYLIAEELNISKGQLCNIAEKCGCLKRDDVIMTINEVCIKRVIDELLPWLMVETIISQSQ